MPSLDLYKRIHSSANIGRARKLASDNLMNATFTGDIGYQVAYLYDWYHDLQSEDCNILRGLDSTRDEFKIPIEVKFLSYSSQTYSKDQITFHIQMRPHQQCNVDYYEELFGKYNAIFPVGLYIDIMDNNDNYNKWLVVGVANFYEAQFSTYEILPCDKVFQWVYNGHKINMCGVLRSQNSYNSGIWQDFKFSTVEDQQKFLVPLNSESEKLYYNQRMIIDAPVMTEPRAWKISKVNRLASNGIANVTLAQCSYNQYRDYIEIDEDGRVIGMWADYYDGNVSAIDSTDIDSVIKYKGAQNTKIIVGGSARNLYVEFYDADGELTSPIDGEWIYKIDDEDASSVIEENVINKQNVKLKFIGDESYIGKQLVITYKTDYSSYDAQLMFNIAGL